MKSFRPVQIVHGGIESLARRGSLFLHQLFEHGSIHLGGGLQVGNAGG